MSSIDDLDERSLLDPLDDEVDGICDMAARRHLHSRFQTDEAFAK